METATHSDHAFRHEALMYAGDEEFLAGTAAFIRDGLSAGEPIMVALDSAKVDRLREHLGAEADLVRWVDIRGIGGNPARITSLWQEFVSRSSDRRSFRGIGEPIWPGRTPAELLEAQRHEALLNVAFAAGPELRLLCPYDVQRLDPAVIDEARRTHPLIKHGAAGYQSREYPGDIAFAAVFDASLPEPATAPFEFDIDGVSPAAVLQVVLGQAAELGIGSARGEDLALAVLAAEEDLGRGGAPGPLRIWQEEHGVICEIRSSGSVHDPLAGRRPPASPNDLRGLWLANQICDLVELRSSAAGTVARLHVSPELAPHNSSR